MFNYFKNKFFTFPNNWLTFLPFLLLFQVSIFVAQTNKNSFLFSPLDIKVSLIKEKNVLTLPIDLRIAKNDLEVLNFLLYEKNTKFSYIDSAIIFNNLSSKFAFLPLILSGYQNHFTSDLSGKGIWSLSYIIALKMNLKVNSFVDQRLDEKSSTEAAIDYLKKLLKQYKSDNWIILSFITSPSYVSNIIKEAKSNKWEVASKFIDQQYLFSIRLINLLDKIKYDSSLDQTKNTKKNLNEFTFKENIFFDAIAQFKSLDFYKIKRDNPFLLGQIIPKNCILNLNNEVGDFLTKNSQKVLNFQDSMIQNLFLDTIQKSKKIYSVKRGDFLGQIAIENNVTVNDIMNWNSLENTIIYQDQKLILVTNLEPHGHEFFVKKISNEKYFWEILADNSKVTIKSLCTYNYYQELKPNQQLIITKK